MTNRMMKYPSVEQFRQVIRAVKSRAQYSGKDENGDTILNPSKPIPTLTFEGTTKIHGTNASVVLNLNDSCYPEDWEFQYQSRERILNLTQDNAGFMLYMKSKEDIVAKFFQEIIETSSTQDLQQVAIYGEWCGQGIQKGVAVSQVPKMFVIFGVKVKVSDEIVHWIPSAYWRHFRSEEDRIFNIYDFQTWQIDIDFNYPELAQAKMIELTEAVENECPVGKFFGVSAIGEGIVWKCVTPGWSSSDFYFKTKGEKHSSSKVKTLAPVDVEAVSAIKDFVEYAVTESRLEQGLHVLQNELLKPFEMKSMGDYIRWVYQDVLKEESDTIVANQLDPKKLGSPIADKARKFFVQRLNANV